MYDNNTNDLVMKKNSKSHYSRFFTVAIKDSNYIYSDYKIFECNLRSGNKKEMSRESGEKKRWAIS